MIKLYMSKRGQLYYTELCKYQKGWVNIFVLRSTGWKYKCTSNPNNKFGWTLDNCNFIETVRN